ncbi:hypothetical protein Tcan_00192 [Toxocara canis]|uniref:Uncharacterized protein n=1 Tax=Toxocara canis TaxID=6265 RepID=A0A0B2VVK9_TOXCA|nr:hypothetical protein Tcan_00192 [Toxocara canis]
MSLTPMCAISFALSISCFIRDSIPKDVASTSDEESEAKGGHIKSEDVSRCTNTWDVLLQATITLRQGDYNHGSIALFAIPRFQLFFSLFSFTFFTVQKFPYTSFH